MTYQKLSIEELNGFRYPNLVAEIIESGYSICILSEHMGHGRCREDNPLILAKVFGDEPIMYEEGNALLRLFGCGFDYLFSHELTVRKGKTAAYYRYYEFNQRMERESMIFRLADDLKERMKKEDDFFLLMQVMVKMDMEDIEFQKLKEAV